MVTSQYERMAKAELRILFIGASKFGFKVLDEISKTKSTNIVGIISAPQNFRISYSKTKVRNFLFHDFETFSRERKIPFALLKDKMDDEELFSFAKNSTRHHCSCWLVSHDPQKWRDLADCYGLHASLLPKYSGGAPLVWAIINDEKRTGITLFQMDSGVDSGKIVSQKVVKISPKETISTLYNKIEKSALEIISEALPMFYEGKITLISQDHSKRTVFPQRNPQDGKIDWSENSRYIERFIRAQTRPYPGAYTKINGKKLIIWKSKISNNKFENMMPGQSIKKNGKLFLKTIDGCIEVSEYDYRK